jgi:hypothetical protein
VCLDHRIEFLSPSADPKDQFFGKNLCRFGNLEALSNSIEYLAQSDRIASDRGQIVGVERL